MAVLTSGDAGPDGLRDLPAGTGWLPKPYTTPDLARALRAALDGIA